MTPQRSHRANRISRLVYSVLLASYPSEIRREHGREMMDAFRKRCASASHNGIGMLALLWASTLRDFAISVSAEWFDWIREHTPRRRNTRLDVDRLLGTNLADELHVVLNWAEELKERVPN